MIKNKELQEMRMRDYFLQATKDILRSEGIKALSVRNIADRAGYSYATLYNYFRDVNDLVFLCVSDFQEECRKFVEDQVKEKEYGIARLKSSVSAYMSFFVEYPGIFELFYLNRVGDFGNKQSTIDLISKSLDDVCASDWDYCINHGLVSFAKSECIRLQLRFSVVGLLLFYLNRRTPESYDSFIIESDSLIEYMFGTTAENVEKGK